MNILLAETQEQYQDSLAQSYRAYDTLGVQDNPDIQILIEKLKKITDTHKYSDGLEIGCGTGRYFHAIKNMKELTGVDPSTEMLKQAVHPVCEKNITVEKITLHKSNILEYSPSGTFSFIYSFGVLGEHIPFDKEVANHISTLSSTGGDFYFTVINPFGSMRIFFVQLLKVLFRYLKIGKKWRVMNLTAYGWNTPRSIRSTLHAADFDFIESEKVQSYPHYLVLARKRTTSS